MELDNEKLAEICARAIRDINAIIDVMVDNEHYPTKELAYDEIQRILIERNVIEKVSE